MIDAGVGMNAEILARAVEPFYSTKEMGRGTGLGLSMVHGLAAQLGGGFQIDSVPGEGTRVDLYLPIADEEAAAEPRTAADAPMAVGRKLHILLVDDEDLVREATAEMMRDLGHDVVEAGGGPEALDMLERGLESDAIVTDYMMPGMNGGQLAKRLEEEYPNVRILLITGYTGPAEDVLHLPRLSKPFGQKQLAFALASLFADDDKVVRLRKR